MVPKNNRKYNFSNTFVEVYRNWSGFGYGVMLCYLHQGRCEYVMFSKPNSFIKEVLNQDLMDLYNRGTDEE
jgi:hypothetical protein